MASIQIPDILQAVLLVVVVAAAMTDLSLRRIPNWIVVLGLITGVVFNAYFRGITGATGALLGALLGAALFGGIYFVGGMGAGDVKLLAAVGAIVGPESLLVIFVLAGILGGVAAIIFLLFSGTLREGFTRTVSLMARWLRFDWQGIVQASDRRAAKALSLPYGAVVASGALLFLFALRHQVG